MVKYSSFLVPGPGGRYICQDRHGDDGSRGPIADGGKLAREDKRRLPTSQGAGEQPHQSV